MWPAGQSPNPFAPHAERVAGQDKPGGGESKVILCEDREALQIVGHLVIEVAEEYRSPFPWRVFLGAPFKREDAMQILEGRGISDRCVLALELKHPGVSAFLIRSVKGSIPDTNPSAGTRAARSGGLPTGYRCTSRQKIWILAISDFEWCINPCYRLVSRGT